MKTIIYAVIITLLAFSAPCYGGPIITRPPVNIPASETAAGIIELAADAEAIAGADTTRALTSANLRAVVLDDAADAALSGTPVVLGIKDKAGNTYYFKGYPTKTAY